LAPFDSIAGDEAASTLAERALELARDVYPLCRSITGNGVRETLRRLAQHAPLEIFEVPSGTPVYDWEIPLEWNLREAWIATAEGRKLVDVNRHALHVMSYSVPVRARMTLQELRPHLHSLPDQPDRIPYRTSYYREAWGFCVAQRDLDTWRDGEYEVVIDSTLKPGSLTYAECLVRGAAAQEVLVYTHTCHPALANDNAIGMAVAAVLAGEIVKSRPNLSYRFVFGPGTIGSIAWLARNEAQLARVRAGLVIGLLGDAGPLTYKRSRRGQAEIDFIAADAVRRLDPHARVQDFTPYGYDERQFCSPGIDLPMGRLTRSPNDAYPEYHSSADNLELLRADAIAQSIQAIAGIFGRIDVNRRFRSTSPKGEPRLGKRGLFRATGGANPGEFEHAMLWLLNLADGAHGLQDAHAASGLPLAALEGAAAALVEAGLLEEVE
jgi:aminopeptidase-like protein